MSLQLSSRRSLAPTSLVTLGLVVIALLYPAHAQAQYGQNDEPERIDVCAKYETESGWSEGYQVSALVISGSDLNDRTNTFNYDTYATYVVIFWARDQASVLRTESVTGQISSFGTEATDQKGRRWKVSTSDICY